MIKVFHRNQQMQSHDGVWGSQSAGTATAAFVWSTRRQEGGWTVLSCAPFPSRALLKGRSARLWRTGTPCRAKEVEGDADCSVLAPVFFCTDADTLPGSWVIEMQTHLQTRAEKSLGLWALLELKMWYEATSRPREQVCGQRWSRCFCRDPGVSWKKVIVSPRGAEKTMHHYTWQVVWDSSCLDEWWTFVTINH